MQTSLLIFVKDLFVSQGVAREVVASGELAFFDLYDTTGKLMKRAGSSTEHEGPPIDRSLDYISDGAPDLVRMAQQRPGICVEEVVSLATFLSRVSHSIVSLYDANQKCLAAGTLYHQKPGRPPYFELMEEDA